MTIEPEHITPRMAAMLRKVGRADLAATGFELDDATFDASRALSPRDLDHAVVHALFDRDAPHASAIRPPAIAPPAPAISATPPATERETEFGRFVAVRGDIQRVMLEIDAASGAAHATGRRAALQRWIQTLLLAVIALTLLAAYARGQEQAPLIVGAKASGAAVAGSLRESGIWYLDCGASTTFTAATSTVTCPGTPGTVTDSNPVRYWTATHWIGNADVMSGAGWVTNMSCCSPTEMNGSATTLPSFDGMLLGAPYWTQLNVRVPTGWTGAVTLGVFWTLQVGGTVGAGSHSYALGCFVPGSSGLSTAITFSAATTVSWTNGSGLNPTFGQVDTVTPTVPTCAGGNVLAIRMTRNSGVDTDGSVVAYFDVSLPHTVQ